MVNAGCAAVNEAACAVINSQAIAGTVETRAKETETMARSIIVTGGFGVLGKAVAEAFAAAVKIALG